MDIEQRAEELASELGADEAAVERDLRNLVDYDVPDDEAVQSVRRKYGNGNADGGGNTPSSVDVADVEPGDGNVTVTVRVLTVGTRSIRYQGDELVIHEGEMADATGKIDYTAWQDFGLEPGDSVTVGNADVREWNDDPELNLNESSTVTSADPVEVEYAVGGDRTLSQLAVGDRGVNVEIRPMDVERRTIDGRDGETEILDGVAADPTARLPLTDWDPHPAIERGESVRVENVYVREFREVPSLNVSEFSTVEVLDRPVEAPESAPRMSVADAVDTGGIYDVEVVGNLVAVRDGSGLIQRCPECGRVVQNDQCRTHGPVDAEDDLRVKGVLDDGTDTLTVVLGRELTEEVYGGGLAEARREAREAMDQTAVAESIAEDVLGREFRVRGHLSVEYGANLDATEFAETDDDPADRARAMLDALDDTDGAGAGPSAVTDGGRDRTGAGGHEGRDHAGRADRTGHGGGDRPDGGDRPGDGRADRTGGGDDGHGGPDDRTSGREVGE